MIRQDTATSLARWRGIATIPAPVPMLFVHGAMRGIRAGLSLQIYAIAARHRTVTSAVGAGARTPNPRLPAVPQFFGNPQNHASSRAGAHPPSGKLRGRQCGDCTAAVMNQDNPVEVEAQQ